MKKFIFVLAIFAAACATKPTEPAPATADNAPPTEERVPAGNGALACWSTDFGKRPVIVTIKRESAYLQMGKDTCQMAPIAYNPRSSEYKGWIRFANNDKRQENACASVMKSFYAQGENKTATKDVPSLYWISVSKEAQAAKPGKIQLGYQNMWDPGAGPELKSMMGCKPDQF